MFVVSNALRRICALGLIAAGLSVATLSAPALAQSDAIIALPIDGETPPGFDVLQTELNTARIEFDRHRSNHIEPDDIDYSILSILRPIEARGRPSGSAIRFDGERRTLEFALFVPDPSQVRAIRIATLSSINVLPDRSRYRVFLNDTEVGEGNLSHFTGFETDEFAMNGAVFLRGQNRVRIELVQYHRIYCGPDASFSLWSDIDLAQSGAVLASTAGITGEEGFLMGLAAAAATGAGIEIRGSDRLGDYRAQWIAQITQQISGALGGDPIPFRFTNYWSVSDREVAASRITFVPSSTNRVSFRMAGDGAQVMVVEFVPNSRPQALPAFERILPVVAPREAPVLIATDTPVPFSAFGFENSEARDRYARFDTRFRLPDDYIVLTNDKAEIKIDYVYIDDLPRGAMMLVHVNDTNIRLLPLRGEAGELIEQFPLRFEARILRAGVNTVTFEVLVPGNPGDLPCPTQDTPMAAIAATTTIEVPYSPSMYLPDMHLAFSALEPTSVVTNDMTARAFDENEVVTIAASLVGGERRNLSLRNSNLHLLSLDDLGSVPMGDYRVDRRSLELALTGALRTEVEVDANGHPDPRPMARTAEQREELRRRERAARGDLDALSVAAPGDGSGPSDGGGGTLLQPTDRRVNQTYIGQAWDWLTTRFWSWVHWLHPRSAMSVNEWLERQRGQAVLLQLDPSRPDQIWMLRAPGSDIGSIASSIVAARTVSEGPRGQISVLDRFGNWQNWIAPDREPTLLEPIGLGNIRHVVGNFVSAMPIRYVTGLFFLALISAFFALRIVISTREHKT